MSLSSFSLKSLLATLCFYIGHTNDLSHFGGKTTRASVSASALKQFYRPCFVVPPTAGLHRDTLNTQAPLAKNSIHSNLARDILRRIISILAGGEACSSGILRDRRTKNQRMSAGKKLLGFKIKKIRQKNKMSQEVLSFESKLHRTYISDIERGNRNVSIKNIEKIAKALKVSLKELMP